jgi:hypothetical protein
MSLPVPYQADRARVLLSKHERSVVTQTQRVYDQARVAAVKADGAVALAAHIMEQVVGLDRYRQSLSEGDPMLGLVLGDIEANAIRQCKKIQNNLYNPWGF